MEEGFDDSLKRLYLIGQRTINKCSMNVSSSSRNICVVGATSGIAEQTIYLLATKNHNLILLARDQAKLSVITDAAEKLGNGVVKQVVTDLQTIDNASELLDNVQRQLGDLDTLVVCHGYLGNQSLAEQDLHELEKMITLNFTSVAALAMAARHKLIQSKHSHPVLLAIGSVAGDRGRAKSYVYGACKNALATLFEGIKHDITSKNEKLHVVLVKPGKTDSPMTQGFSKDGPLWSTTHTIASCIVKAIDGKRSVVYAPGYWRYVLFVIRQLPYGLFNRLGL